MPKQLLFGNYLGMKCAQFSYQEFQEKIQTGEHSRKEQGAKNEVVNNQAIKG